MSPDVCPNCGAEVPPQAKVCPECGSDEQTGWSETAYASQLGLPDGVRDLAIEQLVLGRLVALGTLEELVEQLTWAQLQRHRKPVLLADIDGFWRPLLALFAHMRNLGFIREDFEVRYLVAEKIEDALPMLRAAARRLAAPAA